MENLLENSLKLLKVELNYKIVIGDDYWYRLLYDQSSRVLAQR